MKALIMRLVILGTLINESKMRLVFSIPLLFLGCSNTVNVCHVYNGNVRHYVSCTDEGEACETAIDKICVNGYTIIDAKQSTVNQVDILVMCKEKKNEVAGK